MLKYLSRQRPEGRVEPGREEIAITKYGIGALINFIACGCITIALCIYYFLSRFPLRRRDPEQAVRYMSSHGRKRYRSDDVDAFARSQRERESNSISKHFKSHVVLTCILTALMIVVIVIAATVSSPQPYEVLSYISEIVLIAVIIAFGWLWYFIRRSRIKIYDSFLSEQTRQAG